MNNNVLEIGVKFLTQFWRLRSSCEKSRWSNGMVLFILVNAYKLGCQKSSCQPIFKWLQTLIHFNRFSKVIAAIIVERNALHEFDFYWNISTVNTEPVTKNGMNFKVKNWKKVNLYDDMFDYVMHILSHAEWHDIQLSLLRMHFNWSFSCKIKCLSFRQLCV